MSDDHGISIPTDLIPPEPLDFSSEQEALRYEEESGNSPHIMLQRAAETFKQRAEVYGDNYKKFGQVIAALNMDLQMRSVQDWNRFGLLIQIISKLMRYTENFSKGGHDDSLNDLSVYAAMLRSLDQEGEKVPF